MTKTRALTLFSITFVWITMYAQQVQLKPYAGANVLLNYNAEGGGGSSETMHYAPQRVVPVVGFEVAYISKKHIGFSAGMLYNRYNSRVTATPINGFTAQWKFHDYNLWFPLRFVYELPFRNGERTITFSAGGFLGYHQFLVKKTESYLLHPNGAPGTYNNYHFAGYEPYGDRKKLQAGVSVGFELQPFRKMNGLTLGMDYNLSFSRTAKRSAFIGDIVGNSFVTIQSFTLNLRQQNIAFRLAYTFSVGKHSNSNRWRFLNMVRETDSAYYRIYKTPLKEPELEVPTVSLSPYVHLHAGWAQQIITGKQKPASQRISYNGAAVGYGITTGINYLWQQNMGVGMGFTYYMSSYRLKTMPSAITAFSNSYHSWSTTYSQYLFHLNFVYRHYWQKNYRHVEFVPSLMLGLNRYFSFGYGNMVVSSSTLNNPGFKQTYPEDFRFQFTSGLSNSFSVHPFAKNIGLKFGINYQIDFVRLLPVTYQSTFSNNNNAEVDYREATIQPLPSKLSFTISYSPVIKLKGKK